MTLKVIEYDETEHIVECDSFEFRTNHVANWIEIKDAKGTLRCIHNVCVIKTIDSEGGASSE